MGASGIRGIEFSRLDWRAATRAAVSTGVPLIVLASIDRLDLAIYASFAAFTALYGRNEPYRQRWLTLLLSGAVLLAAVVGGVATSIAGTPTWLAGIGLSLVIAAGVLLTAIMQWIPMGAIFFTFAYLGTSVRPTDPTIFWDAVLVAASVVAFSFAVGMSGALLRSIPALGRRVPAPNRQPHRRLRQAITAENGWMILVTLLAAWAAAVIAATLDVATHHYWAVVTVTAIFSAPSHLFGFERISHRVVGTLVGVGLAAALYGGEPHPIYVIAVLLLCTFATELVVGQHYGFALAFITPLAIGATSLGAPSNYEVLFVARARETLIGGLVCLAVVYLVRRWRRRQDTTAIEVVG